MKLFFVPVAALSLCLYSSCSTTSDFAGDSYGAAQQAGSSAGQAAAEAGSAGVDAFGNVAPDAGTGAGAGAEPDLPVVGGANPYTATDHAVAGFR